MDFFVCEQDGLGFGEKDHLNHLAKTAAVEVKNAQ